MQKRILSLILALSMIYAFAPCIANATANGTCGDNLNWVLDDTGALTISGTGEMTNWFRPTINSPWADYSDRITNAAIDEGVTSIGNQAFYKCTSLKNVVIPSDDAGFDG